MPMSSDDLMMLYGFHVHVVLSIFAIFGLVLFYRWIVTTQKPDMQRNIAVWTMLICGLGIALTVPFCLAGMRLMMDM